MYCYYNLQLSLNVVDIGLSLFFGRAQQTPHSQKGIHSLWKNELISRLVNFKKNFGVSLCNINSYFVMFRTLIFLYKDNWNMFNMEKDFHSSEREMFHPALLRLNTWSFVGVYVVQCAFPPPFPIFEISFFLGEQRCGRSSPNFFIV